MEGLGAERKLAAILNADVKGYSRLMGDDEAATVRTLTAYRDLMAARVRQHRGRVVDFTGDNLLTEFASVVDAVRCAVEIQEELRARNAELPDHRKMEFRIGINLGDVIVEGERIYGDGVNVAARVQGLAEGGGVCISGTAWDQVKNKLAFSYEPLGDHAVKNIAEPVRVYRVLLEPAAAVAPAREDKKRWLRSPWKATVTMAAALALVVGASVAAWTFYFRPSAPPGLELPDKPSIAVLPFANVGADPKHEHFSDGMTEEIITTYRQARIDPLPPASADELLDALVGRNAGTGPLKRLLVERAEGNPFFLEESVRALVETGVLAGKRGAYRVVKEATELHVPTTAQAILAARIDRLTPEDKRRLQAAAVVGKDVPFVLLHAISGESDDDLRAGIARLQAAEFLYETRLFPDVEYTFKHALTHEVAYASLLHERRRALHARIVEAIESLSRERLPEQIERLAHHAVRGELGERAVAYLRQAGQRAASRAAWNEAKRSIEQALGVLESLPERRETLEQAFDIRLDLRRVLVMLGDMGRVLERVREAEALAQRLDDDQRRGRAWAFMGNAHVLLGDAEQSLAWCNRALELAGRLGDVRLRILATSYLGHLSYHRGDYERAVELARENFAAWRPEWHGEDFGLIATPPVFDRWWLVLSLAHLGRFAEAAEPEAEMLRLAEATLSPVAIVTALVVAAGLRFLRGDCGAARRFLERVRSMAPAAHLGLVGPVAVALLAEVLSETGETAEALDRLREGEELWKHSTAARALAAFGVPHSLARRHFALGHRDDARRLAEAGVESAGAALGAKAGLLRLLGDIAIDGDEFDADESVNRYREALALAEPRHMRPLIAHCHAGLAKVYRRTGKPEQEREHFATATTMYREMGMTHWLEKAEAELRSLGAGEGRP